MFILIEYGNKIIFLGGFILFCDWDNVTLNSVITFLNSFGVFSGFGRTSYRGRNVPNNIEEAILSVTSGKLNQSQAAQKYGVTQPTISRRLAKMGFKMPKI